MRARVLMWTGDYVEHVTVCVQNVSNCESLVSIETYNDQIRYSDFFLTDTPNGHHKVNDML